MPSIAEWAANRKAKLDAQGVKNKHKMDTLRSGLDMLQIQAKYQQKMQEASTDEEKKAIEEEMESVASTTLLKVLWTTTSIDITNTLYEVIQMVLFDKSVDKDTRESRAHGLKILGEIFMDCPDPEVAEGDAKDAKKLYEEAAFAAMLETIKRKEEANQKAASGGHF